MKRDFKRSQKPFREARHRRTERHFYFMQRDIKFRAFYRGEMLLCTEKEQYANAAFFCSKMVAQSRREKFEMHLMQFTGLKDKNGKEIYEGDIYTQGRIVTCIVIFREGAFCGHWINKSPETATPINWSGDDSELMVDNFCNQIEVIGNIYENPELLSNG